jgi:hypothetical protein
MGVESMMMSSMMKIGTSLDRIARNMAAQAGIAWTDLNDYPGYVKNLWREEARRMVLDIAPQAVIHPGQMRWDGTFEDSTVLNFPALP